MHSMRQPLPMASAGPRPGPSRSSRQEAPLPWEHLLKSAQRSGLRGSLSPANAPRSHELNGACAVGFGGVVWAGGVSAQEVRSRWKSHPEVERVRGGAVARAAGPRRVRSLGRKPLRWISAAGLFSWHPMLMSLAFSFLMTEALLVFSPESSLLRSLSRKGRARCHWVLQLLALLCALLGLGLVVVHKEQQGKAHLATWHGRAGLLAVLWAGLQCSGGVGLLYPKLLPRWPLAKLKLYHATSGLVGYLLGSASLLLGMCSLWFTATVTGGAWYLAVLCPVLTSLVIMNQVSNAYLYRKRIQP
ncbi:transmembrane reductase CYB561D2 isoform X1 [Tenrec ecaudatus]|uniref:transmembrane reductase CYB561D2 isoform X1 n=1 Tax=Tenrec ecaudatus TaxID=94439 RepID=UPI003F59E4CE